MRTIVSCAAVFLFAVLCSVADAGYINTLTSMPGLISAWHLEETAGNLAADSVAGDAVDGNNVGTYSGTGLTLGVAGPNPSIGFLGFAADNKAVHFNDDANTKLQMATHDVFAGAKDLTIITWVQYPSVPASSTDRRTVGGLQLDAASNKYVFATGFYNPSPAGLQMFGRRSDDSIISGSTNRFLGDVNTWHMWAITLEDGQYARCYLDGELKHTFDYGNNTYGLAAASGLIFGNDVQVSANRPWKGEMDEIAMFNRAISATEVGDLWTAATVPEPSTALMLVLVGLGVALVGRCRR